jgi:hypothetical protein
VDVSEDPLLAVLDDPLPLDLVRQGVFVEGISDDRQAVREDVDVDIRPGADVAGPDAADQAGSESRQLAHHAEGLDPHVAEMLEPLGTFMNPGHGLDLVADLGVGREVAGPESVFDPELFGGLALGGEVLGLGPVVHHLGGEEGELPPDTFVGHGEEVRRLGPSKRRGAKDDRLAGFRRPNGRPDRTGRDSSQPSIGRRSWSSRVEALPGYVRKASLNSALRRAAVDRDIASTPE